MVLDQLDKQYEKLPRTFYQRSNVVQIAKELIGKKLFSFFDGKLTSGYIVETEAYSGAVDKASHAYHGKTPRTEIMFGEGGYAYVYLCYGIHHLFNIVTHRDGYADAVLIRALEPVEGIEVMKKRRGGDRKFRLTAGPGSVGQAMGFNKEQTGTDLQGNDIWITDGREYASIIEDRRVGVDYAGEDANLPWRFFVEDSPWISMKKQKPLKDQTQNG